MLETHTESPVFSIDPLASLRAAGDKPAPEPTQAPVEAPAIDPETAATLAKLGLDRVPTAAEAKELLDARRTEIRAEVLRQADARDWCDDGTRKVCANLRLPRPGNRERFSFQATFTVTVDIPTNAFTEAGALLRIQRQKYLTQQWLNSHLYGMTVVSAKVEPFEVNGTMVQLGDQPTEENPEVQR